ncbi:MAG: hypothetical protein WC052_05295 [Patescibacteria group bacterium]
MAIEFLKLDAQGYPVSGGVTDDASLEVRAFRVDPTTNYLKVKVASMSGSFTMTNLTITGNLEVQGNFTFGDISTDILTATGAIRLANGSAAAPSLGFTNSTTTGIYRAAADTIGFAAVGAEIGTWSATALSLTNGQNLVLAGANAINKGNIEFQGAASAAYDSNLLKVSNNNMTMGMVASATAAYSAAFGPFVALRGITFAAFPNQRGIVSIGAGNPATPLSGEGEIRFSTGADVQRMVIDKSGVIYIPTPTTNRFVVGGTTPLGAGGTSATIIGNSAGVGVLAIQNTTAANAGYAQLDIYNSSGVNVAGFGYGNTATVAATADRTYFYTVAKDFHISTNSNTGRHLVLAATSGNLTLTPSAGTTGVPTIVTITGPAHTGLTATTEDIGININMSATKTWAAGLVATQREIVIQAPTYATATFTTAATVAITGAPIGTIVNPLAFWIQSGASRFDGAIINKQGTDIASAGTIVIPRDGNIFELTGTTSVTLITKTGYQDGHQITLVANENVLITNGTATSGDDITILLAGASHFSMTANDTLTLVLCTTTANGQAWREVARTAI